MVKKCILRDQPKRPSQNGLVQFDLSKMPLLSSWTWGQNTIGGGFLLKFHVKKTKISCNVWVGPQIRIQDLDQ
jgi:hypothetical protein